MAEEHVPEAALRMRVRIVGVVRKRGVSLRYCRSPLPFVEKDFRLRHAGLRIVRLKGQSGVGKFVRPRDVARGVVAPLIGHAVKQGVRQDRHRAHILRVKRKRALGQRHGFVDCRLAFGKSNI